jgi:PhnO protein
MDGSGFWVRRAVLADADQVYTFICELEGHVLDQVIFKKYFEANLAFVNNIYLIAGEAGQACGFLSCHGQTLLHHSGPVYEIQELFVTEGRRNNGIGELLLEHLYDELSGRDFAMLEVASNKKREGAHRFYTRNGFIPSHFKFTKGK